jgi:UDP-glucose 4-epimerase
VTWLVTGGAGYIGRHVVLAMREAGHGTVVLDDLSTGDGSTLPTGVPLVRSSVTDVAALRRTMIEYNVRGVIHLAARKSVRDSMEDPIWYYRQNVVGTLALMEAMVAAGVRRVLHSSSAAVYGSVAGEEVDENTSACPMNPYGETKLVSEWILRDVARSHGLTQSSLRYFNVAGTAAPRLRDRWGTGLIPQVLDALILGAKPAVLGRDYPTRDGSCVRDFVHVADVAYAHRLVAEGLERGGCSSEYNIGSGTGFSVLEIFELVQKVTGIPFEPQDRGRRGGDPASVVACTARIRAELGWAARHTVEDMIRSEWQARIGRRTQGRAQQRGRSETGSLALPVPS